MRRVFDLLIWDLDGTLIDSRDDLVDAVNATRTHMGFGPLPAYTVASYVGNGAPVLIRRALGNAVPQADVDRALDYFIRHYYMHCLDKTALYPGVLEALDRLADAGAKLAILTNKPVMISKRIVAGLGLTEMFFRVYGGNSFDEKKPNPAGILHLMSEARAARERTLMIGDSRVDIETARNARSKSCGVLWGLQPETLADPCPDFTIAEAHELVSIAVTKS